MCNSLNDFSLVWNPKFFSGIRFSVNKWPSLVDPHLLFVKHWCTRAWIKCSMCLLLPVQSFCKNTFVWSPSRQALLPSESERFLCLMSVAVCLISHAILLCYYYNIQWFSYPVMSKLLSRDGKVPEHFSLMWIKNTGTLWSINYRKYHRTKDNILQEIICRANH
jgi:hypothetical protein